MSFIYLASPYTHQDSEVRKQRQQDAEIAASFFMRDGDVVYSPIAHECAIDKHLPKNVSNDHNFWMKQRYAMLDKSKAMKVLLLNDVEQSKGVRLEIIRATEIGIHVSFWNKIISSEGIKFIFANQEKTFEKMGFQKLSLWKPIQHWSA